MSTGKRVAILIAAALAGTALAKVLWRPGGADVSKAGLPDSYLIVEGKTGGQGASPSGALVPTDDYRAAHLHKLFAQGIAAEMMRTTYIAKAAVRELAMGGKTFDEPLRRAAATPTLVELGARTTSSAGLSVQLAPGFTEDKALPATLAGLLALIAGDLVSAGKAPTPLVTGYAWAMEVVAREWRAGEGKGTEGLMPRDAGTQAQRERFAAVRENSYALAHIRPDDPASAKALLTDPGVAATVLYRMAQSKNVGHRIGPDAIYAPFWKDADRLPKGVSPAAVLGPFRNFQAKLLSVWAQKTLEGAPPQDIADLVAAYAAALPDERAEVTRIFVVTTYGATVKAGGVSTAPADTDKVVPELTALAAEVAGGRKSLRAAFE